MKIWLRVELIYFPKKHDMCAISVIRLRRVPSSRGWGFWFGQKFMFGRDFVELNEDLLWETDNLAEKYPEGTRENGDQTGNNQSRAGLAKCSVGARWVGLFL